jgi:hypothetical protein
MSKVAPLRVVDKGPATETVDLSLRLLERLASSREAIGVSDLAREFAASKATVYRHLRALVLHGFVHQDTATARYSAGIKLPSRYSLGRSRHGAPDRKTQKIPLRTRRSFSRGTPRALLGSIGLMAIHSLSTTQTQLVDAVIASKTRNKVGPMLVNAAHQIIGHADIKRSADAARKDVDPIAMLKRHGELGANN